MEGDEFTAASLMTALEEGDYRPAWNTSYWLQYGGNRVPLKAVARRAIEIEYERGPTSGFQSRDLAAYTRGIGFDVIHEIRLANERDQQLQASYAAVLARPEQARFRQLALEAYGARCIVSGCTTIRALEAAHVLPYSSGGPDERANCILLRADLHRMFDANLLAVNPLDGKVHYSETVTPADRVNGDVTLELPQGGPTYDTFTERWVAFNELD